MLYNILFDVYTPLLDTLYEVSNFYPVLIII